LEGFFTECTDQGNDFELIPKVEMETRNLVEGYFGGEFSMICNYCGVMVLILILILMVA